MVKLTSCPVQNMGHLVHGASRASPSQALRYGLRTMSGSTGGFRTDASTAFASSAEAATTAWNRARIGGEMMLEGRWIKPNATTNVTRNRGNDRIHCSVQLEQSALFKVIVEGIEAPTISVMWWVKWLASHDVFYEYGLP